MKLGVSGAIPSVSADAQLGKVEKGSDSLRQLVDQLSESLVLLDVEDLPALASLHDLLLRLHAGLVNEKCPVADVAQECSGLVESILLRDVKDIDAALFWLGDAITNLQSIIHGDRTSAEVSFQPSLTGKGTGQSNIKNDDKHNLKPATFEFAAESNEPTKKTADGKPGSLYIELIDADSSLVIEFISEARDHCATAEQKMMELDTGEDYSGTVNAIFRSFHSIKSAAGFLALQPIQVLAHESETLLDMVREGTLKIEDNIADLIFATIDSLRQLLTITEQVLKNGGRVGAESVVVELSAKLRQVTESPQVDAKASTPRSSPSPDADSSADTKTNLSFEMPGESISQLNCSTSQTSQPMSRADQDPRPGSTPNQAMKEMVKIDTERLDRLVDTIGELIIAESMVGHDEEFLELVPPRIAKNVSHLNKITRELQEMGMAMRLVPIRGTFQKLARAVRDLTRKSGKQIELLMSGEDAEVDRSIIEHIGDPLMHMIRNSVDHAIESPQDRLASGKSATGHIWLRAFHRGGSIHFEIEDDGRGLDSRKLKAKAVDKGLIDQARDMSEREIFQLILLPGFSTAEKVTDISGRGVGMDVVKKNIEALRGHLEIESRVHEGTKFTMKLPLTLAMIDGMLVRVGGERFIIPTMSVVESVNLANEKVFTIQGERETINLRGILLPILRLAEMFGLRKTGVNSVVIIAEDNDKRVGLVVDELIGQRQTVIKSLGPVFSQQEWVSGGALLSDGTVGLILDISGIVHLAESTMAWKQATNRGMAGNPALDRTNSLQNTEPGIRP